MPKTDHLHSLIGNDAPLSATKKASAPDRREVSVRWLAASVLVGVTSLSLMGTALFVALDGKQFLATPPELASLDAMKRAGLDSSAKSARLSLPRAVAPQQQTDRRRMSVSTMTRQGNVNVVRTKPFEHLKIALAADNRTSVSYPQFNPMTVFADGDNDSAAAASSIIYGASVETEASIMVEAFDMQADLAANRFAISDEEAEEVVRSTAPVLVDGNVEIASLYYVDPLRFGDDPLSTATLANTARIIPQNISVAPIEHSQNAVSYTEIANKADETTTISELLDVDDAQGRDGMANALATLLNTQSLASGHTLRIGIQQRDDARMIVRTSVYDGREHVLTIALNDQDQYVPAAEPSDPGIMADHDDISTVEREIVLLAERDLPTVYDAIYKGVLAHGLDADFGAKIVRMVASDVDFRSRIRLNDNLELFYSVPEEGEDDERQLLYVNAAFGGQTRSYYLFTDSNGKTDFYDSEGRSARQFLLRNPVPNGKFRSGFGMRRHPILKYSKMHWGVDWSAPRGTPIIAPGNGVVKRAGWAGGYGKQTIIQHANGYETSYSHQTNFAKGIREGARVRQGQVIGYVGTTGLSTGPHLHYEMRVNGERVDPMRVRLPEGSSLKGADLAAFTRERDRIDALLQAESPDLRLADAS